MSISYRLTITKVEPSGTELPDNTEEVLRTDTVSYMMVDYLFRLFKNDSAFDKYRIRLVEIESKVEKHKTIELKLASCDNPFVT